MAAAGNEGSCSHHSVEPCRVKTGIKTFFWVGPTTSKGKMSKWEQLGYPTGALGAKILFRVLF